MSTTLYATKAKDREATVIVWWGTGCEWIKCGGYWAEMCDIKEGNYFFLTDAAFRLLFGLDSTPPADECWEFVGEAVCNILGVFDPIPNDRQSRCWRLVKVHKPPAPSPARTWALKEIEQAMNTIPQFCTYCKTLLPKALEALPRREPREKEA